MRQSKFLIGVFGVSVAFASVGMAYGADRAPAQKEKSEAVKHATQQKAESEEAKLSNSGTTREREGESEAVRLSNKSDQPLTLLAINFSGKDSKDFTQTNNCGTQLAGKASCTINVTFAPHTRGNKSATLEVQTSGGTHSVALSGTGV